MYKFSFNFLKCKKKMHINVVYTPQNGIFVFFRPKKVHFLLKISDRLPGK